MVAPAFDRSFMHMYLFIGIHTIYLCCLERTILPSSKKVWLQQTNRRESLASFAIVRVSRMILTIYQSPTDMTMEAQRERRVTRDRPSARKLKPVNTLPSARSRHPSPFQHIKILSQPSADSVPTEDKLAEIVFKKLSLAQETTDSMAYHEQKGLTQASLANMPSGMSFAQKARAAELNAARSRRAAKEAEDQVPELAPVSLVAYTKFTKRSRAKGGKKLDELLTEEDLSSDEHRTRPSSAQDHTSQPAPHGYGKFLQDQAANTTHALNVKEPTLPSTLQHSPPTSEQSYSTQPHLPVASQKAYHQQYNANMSRQTSHGQYPYAGTLSTPASSHQSSRQSSVLSHQPRPDHRQISQTYRDDIHIVSDRPDAWTPQASAGRDQYGIPIKENVSPYVQRQHSGLHQDVR